MAEKSVFLREPSRLSGIFVGSLRNLSLDSTSISNAEKKAYDTVGRFHSLDQAKQIDDEQKDLLEKLLAESQRLSVAYETPEETLRLILERLQR